MTNYYKYLPYSPEDESWGLFVLNAGCNRIEKSQTYPPQDHPSHHYFNWNNGRVFDEYQIIYIPKGAGSFESESCPLQRVKEGTVILLFPTEWHRFKPDENTGWDEFWVGFKGNIAENLIGNRFLHPTDAVLNIGIKENVLTLLMQIIEETKCEKPGYQPLISGAVMHLLGHIHSIARQGKVRQEDTIETIVNRAKIIFRTNLDQNIPIEKVTEELQISYSLFRKAFKAYTGIPPGQFLLHLKIERAKVLLSDPSKSIKEIAFELKFESEFYFSKLFKEKLGLSPNRYRKNTEI